MVAETSLNQIVKGAPSPDTKLPPVAPLPPLAAASTELVVQAKSETNSKQQNRHRAPSLNVDSALPSSPPQIYLNLLILEASLRSQYVHLLSRRRLNTFFLLILALWNAFFIYALFLRPREDGQGLGGSVYWAIDMVERLFFIGGVVAALLVKATGQWERGIRWPRRWLGTTNRGLRGFNLRVVVTKGKWWSEMFGHFAFLLPFGLWREAGGSDWHLVEHENGGIVEEDLERGGDHIMLLLLPKNFSSEFRENWEAYRSEYWEKENSRRDLLRKKVKTHKRAKARDTGGWKWWTGAWRLAGSSTKRRNQDLEKHPHSHSHHHHSSSKHHNDLLKQSTRRRSLMRNESHSRTSSRSTTPHLADIDGAFEHNGSSITTSKPLSERVRRGSSVSSTSSVRRQLKSTRRPGVDGMLSPLTAADEDESKERRRKRKEKDKSNSSDNSRPTTPLTENTVIVGEDREFRNGDGNTRLSSSSSSSTKQNLAAPA